ncbi:hypothetical protein FSP39_003322 [Pinctada imbricata]|uniref:Reverse transcriptase domain-containing protein n=1 Tax=Pinctada imbricata TaxID=66713 RepID=A0AA89C6B8_PINIB|nr:hypothetical protein FSP39_003322 [Pinctada imbricata]
MSITQDPWIIESVNGVRLNFLSTPVQNQKPFQPKFSQADQKLIDSEINGLIEKNAVQEVNHTPNSFYSNIFLVPKKGGELRPVFNLRELNLFLPYEHFKMEGIHMLKDLLTKNDWMIKIDLKDAYLTVSIAEEDRQYLKFLWKDKVMQFSSLPFGIALAPRVFTKLMKVPMAILRRLGIRLIVYLDDILIMNQSLAELQSDLSTAVYLLRGLGFIINAKKICFHPYESNRISRFYGSFGNNDTFVAKGKGSENSRPMSRIVKQPRGVRSSFVTNYWSPDHNNSGCFSSSPSLSKFTDFKNQSPSQRGSLRLQSFFRRGFEEGVALVGDETSILERQSTHKSKSSFSNTIRCKSVGVGSSLPGIRNRGIMASRREKVSHQLIRTESSVFCSTKLCKNCNQQTCLNSNRQPSSSCVCKQNGGNEISETIRSCASVVGLGYSKGNNSVGGIPSGYSQHLCRLAKSKFHGFEQLEAESFDFSQSRESYGSIFDGSFCGQNERSNEQILQLEAGSPCRGHECPCSDMDSRSGLCVPAFLPNRSLSSESERGVYSDSPNHSYMANTALVPNSPSNVYRPPSPLTHERDDPPFSHGGQTPTNIEQHVATSRLEGLRRSFSSRGFSEEVKQLLLHSLRPGTKSAYDSAWKKWDGWCFQREVDPFSPPVASILEFLAWMHNQNFQYRTINVHRSAISSVLPQVEGIAVGNLPVVRQLMKGILIKTPPLPKHTYSWDISKVLNYIKELPENESLSLNTLSEKLAILLSLAAPKRVSEISRLDRKCMIKRSNSVIFTLPGLSKTQSDPRNRTVEYTEIPDTKLCVVKCMSVYESKTDNFREHDSVSDPLLRSTKRPYKGISSQTVAKWIKCIMTKSGIDTNKFQAHSCRMVSTTKAALCGASIEQIIDQADWSNASTFKKFYFRPNNVENASYSSRVLLHEIPRCPESLLSSRQRQGIVTTNLIQRLDQISQKEPLCPHSMTCGPECQTDKHCPKGYSCMTSGNNPFIKVCCEKPLCPDKMTCGEICGDDSQCPNGYYCQQSMNNPHIKLCCEKPLCPDSAKCGDKCMGDEDCAAGYECLQSSNNPYVKMCCEKPGCKPGYLCGGKCKTDEHCPNGYSCVPSDNNPHVSVCCEKPICPDGEKCGDPCMTNEDCSPGYSCLQAPNNPYVKMCCEVPTCPEGCDNGGRCLADGMCPPGYTCKPSTNNAAISLCCQDPVCPAGSKCAGECSPDGMCPEGYGCLQSENNPYVKLCCEKPVCPHGGLRGGKCGPMGQCHGGFVCLPAENNPQISLCCEEPVCPDQSMSSGPCVGDGHCPAGSHCLVSGNNPNVRLCCEKPICPDGRTCGEVCMSDKECAPGYTCEESANNPHVRVCCEKPVCPHSKQCGERCEDDSHCPAGYLCEGAINNPNYRMCCEKPTCPDHMTCGEMCMSDDTCPPGYRCKQSSNNPHIKVCCEEPICSDGNNCIGRCTDGVCAPGYECKVSSNNPYVHLCCEIPLCHDGSVLAGRCINGKCPSGYACQESANNPYIQLCCEKPMCPDGSKCGDKCMHNDHCPPGYSCQQAVNNPYMKVCCEEPVCSDGCVLGGKCINGICPDGFNCQPAANNPGLHVCCEKPLCPDGRSCGDICKIDAHCPNGYSCLQSINNPHVRVCCENPICEDECAFGGKCIDGMCPNGFQCQTAKNNPHMQVCCEKPLCPNGRTCGDKCMVNEDCASGYTCEQSINNPFLKVRDVHEVVRVEDCVIVQTTALRDPVCPYSMRNGGHCGPHGECAHGYVCSKSDNNPYARLCCEEPLCPKGEQGHGICSSDKDCPKDLQCRLSINNPYLRLCCSCDPIPKCPGNVGSAGKCRYGGSCPRGYACTESANVAGAHLCCRRRRVFLDQYSRIGNVFGVLLCLPGGYRSEKVTECRRRLSQLLHTHVILIGVCVLSALDASCVLGQIICDILIMSEKQLASEQLESEALEVVLKLCPDANHSSHDHSPGLSDVIEEIKTLPCYNTSHDSHMTESHNVVNQMSQNQIQGYNLYHRRRKRAAGSSGDHHGHHVDHTLNEHLTHAFHLGSMVILSILVAETFLKIFAMGSKFLHHRLEVFDAFVVTVSWILDVAFYEGIWAKPGTEAVTILIIILPWRVIRIVNSFVLVIQEKDLVLLKVVKQQYRRTIKREKEAKKKLDLYRVEVRQLQGLCRKRGANEVEITACAPIGRKKRRRSSVLSGMSSFASLAMIGSIGSQPELDRVSSSSEDEDDDRPSPTKSDISKAKQYLRSNSVDSGLSDTVSFSLSPDPSYGNGAPVFAFDNIDYKLTDEVT